MVSLTVLNVAFPFAPTGPDALGGAEQVLSQLDAALVGIGQRSVVVAAEGSVARGKMYTTEIPKGQLNEATRSLVLRRHREQVDHAIEQCRPDVVHMHGIDFHRYLPPPGVPVLVTLHLPPSWYPEKVFRLQRANTFLHCVSAFQRGQCPQGASLLPDICNGVAVEALPVETTRRNVALSLGRICPEKNFHEALEASERAGVPFLLAGPVFPYKEHEQYFREQIAPRLNGSAFFMGPASYKQKRRLLSSARCLLIPSRAPETSSLVAMEAFACGTPVIAYRSGALPEIVEHGVTGFVVDTWEEMSEAIGWVDELDAQQIRRIAAERFSLERTIQSYLEVYQQLSDARWSASGFEEEAAR